MSFRDFALIAAVAAASLPVSAANFSVNTTADTEAVNLTTGADASGNISLRSALQAANNTPASADTIYLSAQTYRLTLAGADENDCATGDLDVLGPVTIVGAGPGATIIEAGDSVNSGIDKVFSINPYWDTAFSTTIEGVTIRHGRNPSDRFGDGYGGALDWDSAGSGQLTMTNCVITASTCLDGDGGAVGLFTAGGTVVFNNCTFSSCTCANGVGAGVFVNDGVDTTFNNCTIASNTAYPGVSSTANGAGIYAAGPVTFHGCTLSGNLGSGSSSKGGGIYALDALAVDQGCVFSNNSCGSAGGALYIDDTTAAGVSIKSATFAGNGAPAGGAISVSSGDISVSFCRFAGNASGNGRGIYKDANPGSVTAANNWWGQNAGPGAGGADDVAGSVTATPYLKLTLTPSVATVERNASATLTASLNTNSSDALVGGSSGNYLPDSTAVSWGATGGSIASAASTFTNGTATAQYTGAGQISEGTASVTVDSETVSVSLDTVPVHMSHFSAE